MTSPHSHHNDIIYWYPILKLLRVPTPKTILIDPRVNLMEIVLDNKEDKGYDYFIKRLKLAASQIGYPCFLRSGHTSHKHDWKDSCYLTEESQIKGHINTLVEFCACCDMFGLQL